MYVSQKNLRAVTSGTKTLLKSITLPTSAILSHLSYKDPVSMYGNKFASFLEEQGINKPSAFYDGNPSKDSQAYMWMANRKAYISFRGTESFRDALNDIDVRMTKMKYGSNIQVHQGFLDQFNSIKKLIIADLVKHISTYDEIYITGHSLGGALATLAAAEVKTLLDKKIICTTFGSPRVGNYEFSAWFLKYLGQSTRVVNQEDPVPMIPFSSRFYHVPLGICFDDSNNVHEINDDKWISRPLNNLQNIDFTNIIKDHSCEIYIDRIMKLYNV